MLVIGEGGWIMDDKISKIPEMFAEDMVLRREWRGDIELTSRSPLNAMK